MQTNSPSMQTKQLLCRQIAYCLSVLPPFSVPASELMHICGIEFWRCTRGWGGYADFLLSIYSHNNY